jgi:hypothetical protein
MKRWQRGLMWVSALVLLGYGGAVAYFWSQQRHLVFEPEAVLLTTPARNGLNYDEVRIPSGQGAEQGELVSWWVPAGKPGAPTILYLHGNFRNISLRPEVMRGLHELGYNQLLVDYRGYGQSRGGWPSEAKVYEDAEAAWNWLRAQRGVPPGRTFIYGHSLGGAIAADLAVKHPEAAGLVIESSFTSMAAMGELNYGFLPIGTVLDQRFDTVGKIAGLKIPLLILHGTQDRKIPWQMGRELYERAPQPKSVVYIDGAEHSNIPGFAWIEYRAALSDFVRRYAH